MLIVVPEFEKDNILKQFLVSITSDMFVVESLMAGDTVYRSFAPHHIRTFTLHYLLYLMPTYRSTGPIPLLIHSAKKGKLAPVGINDCFRNSASFSRFLKRYPRKRSVCAITAQVVDFLYETHSKNTINFSTNALNG